MRADDVQTGMRLACALCAVPDAAGGPTRRWALVQGLGGLPPDLDTQVRIVASEAWRDLGQLDPETVAYGVSADSLGQNMSLLVPGGFGLGARAPRVRHTAAPRFLCGHRLLEPGTCASFPRFNHLQGICVIAGKCLGRRRRTPVGTCDSRSWVLGGTDCAGSATMSVAFDMAALRQLLSAHLHRADALAESCGHPLPSGRKRVLEGVARCGDPFHGFVWLRCDGCSEDRVLATSCKGRLVCPRCGGRRMASSAAHLVDRVLPDHRYRQWVITFPPPLPQLLSWQPALLGRMLAAVSGGITGDLRRRTGRPSGSAGLVTFVQNFTGDLRCFVHLHSLVADGVFEGDRQGRVRFVPAAVPSRSDIQRVAEELAASVHRTVIRWRRQLDEDDQLALGEERLVALARLGERRVGAQRPCKSDRPAARQRRWMGEHLGLAVHAGVTVDQGDAGGRERLVRYIARPALSLQRVFMDPDGWVQIQFKRPWQNGTTGVRLKPELFVLRLASLVMPAWVNLVRYHGVFAPNAPLRPLVVRSVPQQPGVPRPRWIPWNVLFKRVFGEEPDLCSVCGVTMERRQTLQGHGRAWSVLKWIEAQRTLARGRGPPSAAAAPGMLAG